MTLNYLVSQERGLNSHSRIQGRQGGARILSLESDTKVSEILHRAHNVYSNTKNTRER